MPNDDTRAEPPTPPKKIIVNCGSCWGRGCGECAGTGLMIGTPVQPPIETEEKEGRI